MNYEEAVKIIENMDVEKMAQTGIIANFEAEAILKGQRALESCIGRGEEGEDY